MGSIIHVGETMIEKSVLEVAYENERSARIKAEKALEEKTMEVYNSMLVVRSQYEAAMARQRELELFMALSSITEQQKTLEDAIRIYVESVSSLMEAKYAFVSECVDKGKSAGFFNSFGIVINEQSRCIVDFLGAGDEPRRHRERVTSAGCEVQILDVEAMGFHVASVYQSGGVGKILVIPIRRYDRVVSIAEFGLGLDSRIDDRFLSAAEAASYQLAVLLERMDTERKLKINYDALKVAHNELKTAQAQLVQSEKMASLGQLAAGVAHEINNPIGFVLSNVGTLKEYISVFTDLLEFNRQYAEAVAEADQQKTNSIKNKIEDYSKSSDLSFILGDIEGIFVDAQNGLVRVKEIVANLKRFARADEGDWAAANINEIIENTLKVIWNELKYKVKLNKNYGEVPSINCSASQLGQVFMNMLVNAAQAIPSQGDITIKTGVYGEHIFIEISDNGCGIPLELQSRIFDPFFTTKPVNVGTGLGLSISYGIIEKHGGKIHLESTPNVGATFRILMPIRGS